MIALHLPQRHSLWGDAPLGTTDESEVLAAARPLAHRGAAASAACAQTGRIRRLANRCQGVPQAPEERLLLRAQICNLSIDRPNAFLPHPPQSL